MVFVTGHEDRARASSRVDWAGLARGADTIVIYMGVHQAPEISRRLIEGGRAPETPAAAIRWGTHARQAVVEGTLATIAGEMSAAGLGSPAIIVIGEVVRLRSRLRWFETQSQELWTEPV